ncbi:HAD family hydrolase [Paenibacillus thermoaerophilus]|uniref:HAD family hydrolase n=1 Tax=Paenibacillus thermoaerophilus TaxID=1215385 RepID=A0ABW2UYT8_9BACL|nr:HAD hydrolase-like protein [Paenibacillus thermoaerophilus]TMV16037.1 HAD family hydrolase [Paenibacillus thermoaerophilus]
MKHTDRQEIVKPEAMIFDLDGTLFRTESILLRAYRRVFDTLRAEGLYAGDVPPEERILSSLGMLLEQIWYRVMPEAGEAARRRADELLLLYEKEELEAGRGELYPGVAETLRELRARGVRLFIASNGLEAYVKDVPRVFGIAGLFEAMYSAGEYRTSSKVDLVRLLLERHDVRRAWMVGDRSSDVEAGKRNGLVVAGCLYAGFGRQEELDGADFLVGSFPELLERLERLD